MAGTTKSSIGGGGTRATDHHGNGTSTDRDYDKNGKCVAITDHDRNGDSHTHKVESGWLGPYKGSVKK